MKAPWLLLKWTTILLLLESGASQPAPPEAGLSIPRPEDTQSLSFHELDRAASDVIQRLKSINPEGKVVVIGGAALQKYLPGYRSTRDMDIYQTIGNSGEIKKELLKDPRFYTRQAITDNIDISTKKYLFYKNANGKNIEIDLPGKHVLTFEPTSARVLRDIPAGTVPYLSVDELIISKIESSRQRPEVAKKALDISDAKELLQKYPETTFTSDNHRQIAEKFRSEQKSATPVEGPPKEGEIPAGEKLPSATENGDHPDPEIIDTSKPPPGHNPINTDQKNSEIPCRRAGDLPCVRVSTDESRPTGEKPVKSEPVNEGELIAVAQQRSKESFDNLLEEFNYKSVVKHDQLYKELNERLPEFNPVSRTERITGLSVKFGEGALTVAGIALYGKAVADVFSSDASVLDKAAVVTSILPGIGCAVQLADNIERGHVDAAHTALCFAEDALFVSGFWEIALVMQVGEELSNWIQAENERDKLWDMDLLSSKGAEGWLDNVKRLIKHLKSDEFVANATTQLSTYKILTLYQASQLTGDLHAAHQVLENATIPAHEQPELKRQICSTIAESKFQLQMKLEAIALNHTAKLEREFKKKFLDDWLKAATTPTPIFGITLPDWPSNIRRITEEIDRTRNMPLQLHETEVKRAIREVIERLETPAPCQCVQGKKGGKCEFGDCQSPKPEGRMDAGGRLYATNVWSMERAQRMRLTPKCQALFTTCPVGSTAGDIGRPLWCTPGK